MYLMNNFNRFSINERRIFPGINLQRPKFSDLFKSTRFNLPNNRFQLDVDNQIPVQESVEASTTLTAEEKQHLRSILFDRKLSPITASLREMEKLPPTGILTCQTDPLTDEGVGELQLAKSKIPFQALGSRFSKSQWAHAQSFCRCLIKSLIR